VRNAALVLLAQVATAFGGLREGLERGGRLAVPLPSEPRSPHASSVIH